MSFADPDDAAIRALQGYGMRVVPVRPGGGEILGEPAYPGSADMPFAVDLVDLFRTAEHVPAIVGQCLALHCPALWLQEGIVAKEAALRAQAAGLVVVMDRCLYKEYLRLFTA